MKLAGRQSPGASSRCPDKSVTVGAAAVRVLAGTSSARIQLPFTRKFARGLALRCSLRFRFLSAWARREALSSAAVAACSAGTIVSGLPGLQVARSSGRRTSLTEASGSPLHAAARARRTRRNRCLQLMEAFLPEPFLRWFLPALRPPYPRSFLQTHPVVLLGYWV